MSLTAAAGLLRCPLCRQHLQVGETAATCEDAHSFDIAARGYLNLLGRAQPANADTPAMLAARSRVHASGILDRVKASVTATLHRAERILEVGSGTADYLKASLGEAPQRRGLALDVSVAAGRAAGRLDPRIAAVVADVWQELPLATHALDGIIAAFAPRNLPEFARVLRPEGLLVVVTPNPDHLIGLRAGHGLLGIEATKNERLLTSTREFFTPVGSARYREPLQLSAALATDLIAMGPNAHHGEVTVEHDCEDVLDVTVHAFEVLAD